MIDTLAILFSSGMVAFIVYRAMKLDKRLPWFGPPPASFAVDRTESGKKSPAGLAPAQRRRGDA